jgi:hypothetical protein
MPLILVTSLFGPTDHIIGCFDASINGIHKNTLLSFHSKARHILVFDTLCPGTFSE